MASGSSFFRERSDLMNVSAKIAVIGVGNMASAIISGILSAKPHGIDGNSLILFNRTPEKAERFSSSGALVAPSATDAVSRSGYVLLAVKPQNIPDLLAELAPLDLDGKVFVSICAGISSELICSRLGREVPVVRVMPNTPLQMGLGVSAVSRNSLVTDDDFQLICDIFGCSGTVLRIREEQMDAIVGVNGSSPAYFYYFFDAMVKSARAQGVDVDENELVSAVCRTAIGAAEMLMRSGKTPEELIRAVTSPNGTTERAMNVLKAADAAGTIDAAMRACTERSKELAAEAAAK